MQVQHQRLFHDSPAKRITTRFWCTGRNVDHKFTFFGMRFVGKSAFWLPAWMVWIQLTRSESISADLESAIRCKGHHRFWSW